MTEPDSSVVQDIAALSGEPAEAAEPPPPAHWVPPRQRWPSMVGTALAGLILVLAILALWRLPPFQN